MGNDINQHRARIGSFNNCTNRLVLSNSINKIDPTENQDSTYKFSYLKIVIMIPILISFCTAINLSDSHLFKSTSALPSHNGQASTPDLMTSILLPYTVNTLAASSFSMVTNFQSRYLHGNKKNQGIKICHWNKGGSHLVNKMPEIRNIVSGLHPHIFGISEANLLQNHDQTLVQLTDYNFHLPLTHTNPSLRTSRIVTYTHKSVIAKPRPDLMSDTISSIWMEVGLPRHKRFLVCQNYREWQLLNQGADNSSLSIAQQLVRWLEFLDQWERALDTGLEVHTLGDMNINHLNWTDQSLSPNNQTSKLKSLISALFSRIFPHGVTQCVQGATRHWPGQPSSGLDHYYTNRPDKLSPVQTQHRGGLSLL